MRIDLILFLASSAHLAGKNNGLAVAAHGSEHSTTKDKATFESVDENRFTTSERSLRVRARMDEEDEERVTGAFVKDVSSKAAQLVTTPFLRERENALKTITRLFPKPSDDNLYSKYAALKRGLRSAEEVNKLVESYPDLLLETLATHFGYLSLSRALVGMASKTGAPPYLITLREGFMNLLVKKGMTPSRFVDELQLGTGGVLSSYRLESLDEFLKAFKRANPEAQDVTIGQLLVSTRTWESESHLLYYLSFYSKKNPVAIKALDKVLRPFHNLDELVTALNVKDNELMRVGVLTLLENFVSLRKENNSNAVFDFLLQRLGKEEFSRQLKQAGKHTQLDPFAKTYLTWLRAKLARRNVVK
ncbi:hypothetical protein PsorP6_013171 [Peronosclerospora sorghi]|uniref:Uncharacterized protein n=1 Tax=Peronosclerospora sorghi TaxID=230839 RepID=A0ACC0WHK9_9STRA|nr:hypothetical protein PsorP6_013171 [Peronosclerospora sorghi]